MANRLKNVTDREELTFLVAKSIPECRTQTLQMPLVGVKAQLKNNLVKRRLGDKKLISKLC